jgi:hypothetical protein
MKEDAVSKTDKEILEEKAKTLGFAGYRLEEKLNELAAIAKEMEKAASVSEYNELAARFNRVRDEAMARKYELTIHREAIGARFHKDMERHYPVPEKKEYRAL